MAFQTVEHDPPVARPHRRDAMVTLADGSHHVKYRLTHQRSLLRGSELVLCLSLALLTKETMVPDMHHVDRKSLYTSLEARIDYLHKFLDWDDSKLLFGLNKAGICCG